MKRIFNVALCILLLFTAAFAVSCKDDPAENGTVSVRARKEGDGGTKTVDAFIEQVLTDIRTLKK